MSESEQGEQQEREMDAGEAEQALGGVIETPGIHLPLKLLSSNVVRDWVRSALVPQAVQRLYEIGMGRTMFKVPTMTGAVVTVPAPATVQRAALRDVVSIGVPPQVGLTDGSDELPGVLALGELELADARAEVHAERSNALPRSGGIEVPESAQGAQGTQGEAQPYVPPDGHTVVEVNEHTTGSKDERGERPAPPVDPNANPRAVLAREILAKRRARSTRSAKDGPKAGTHPNHE